MADNRQERLKLLGRKNKGRLMIDDYISQLAFVGLVVPTSAFEPLPVSDVLLNELNSIDFKAFSKEKVTPNNLKPLSQYIDSVLSLSSGSNGYYLFSEVAKYCGLVKIDRQYINSRILIDLIDIEMHHGSYALMSLEMRTWFDSDEEVIDGKYQQCYTVECHSHKKVCSRN